MYIRRFQSQGIFVPGAPGQIPSRQGFLKESVRGHSEAGAVPAALTAPAAAWAVVYAFLERGYMAYGGECLFIVAAFMGVYWALGSFINDGGMDRL